MGEFTKRIGESLKPILQNLKESVKETAKNLYQSAKSRVSDAVSGAKETVTGAYESVKSKVGGAYKSTKSAVSSAVAPIRAAVKEKGFGGAMKDLGKSLFSKAKGGIKTGLNWTKDKGKAGLKWVGEKGSDLAKGGLNALKNIKGSVLGASEFIAQYGRAAWEMVSNPKILMSELKAYIPKVGKNFVKIFKGSAGIGTVLDAIFGFLDYQDLLDQGASKEEIYKFLGRAVPESIGGIVGGSLAAALVSAPTAAGIPTVLLSGLAYAGGDMIGRWLTGNLAEALGAESFGKSIADAFGLQESILESDQRGKGIEPSLPVKNGNQEIQAEDFTIRTHPKDTLLMAGGTKFGEETNQILKQLLEAVSKGGNIYMDGNKVGQTLVLSSYKSS